MEASGSNLEQYSVRDWTDPDSVDVKEHPTTESSNYAAVNQPDG